MNRRRIKAFVVVEAYVGKHVCMYVCIYIYVCMYVCMYGSRPVKKLGM
jgi:hypothetical protein